MMSWQEYYGSNSTLRAMYETIGNYHQREYAISTDKKGMVRWLYLPFGFYSVAPKIQFPLLKPDKYYYSTAILDWKAGGCYYKLWRPNLRDPAKREKIKDKCNAAYNNMVRGFDCAIDVDSHNAALGFQENTNIAAALAAPIAEHLDGIKVPYILHYSGRGFTFRVPWSAEMLQLGSPFEVRDKMFWWIEGLQKAITPKDGAVIDNVMNQDKRISKVVYSLISYYDESGKPTLTTYAKQITKEELEGFVIPEPHTLKGEHLKFASLKGNYSEFIKELKQA